MIELENGYVIQVDEMNNTLQRRSVSKDGNEYFKTYGYYGSLENALEAYFRIAVAQKLETNTFSLKEAVEIIRAERDRITKLIG